MGKPIPDERMSSLSSFVASRIGLHFPPDRWRDLERGIISAAGELGFTDAESCIAWLLSSRPAKSQIEILASCLTVGETYFFRQSSCFEALEHRIFPELIRKRNGGNPQLRIWSAGCATGEEPYSIAILLHRLMAEGHGVAAAILATDINPRYLRIAAEGVYGPWSFRGVPEGLRSTYFEQLERNKFRLRTSIKNRVIFSYLNLADDPYPSLLNSTNAMDVIFCRNVLMYFSPEQASKVVGKLCRSLVDGGWLIVSPCEVSTELFSQFSSLHYHGAILYQKNAAASVPAMEWVSEPAPAAADSQEPFDLSPFPVAEERGGPLSVELAEPQVLESPPPPVPPTPYEAARALYENGCYAQVIELLESCQEDSCETAEAYALLTRAYANLGRLADALAHCERAIERNKLHGRYHYLRAAILLEQGALDGAKQALKRTLYLEPDFVPGHLALANLTRQQGETEAATRHLATARGLLSAYELGEIVPGSEGITAGRLREILDAQQGLQPSGGRHSVPSGRAGTPAGGLSRGRERG
jgi:chemotaxis protein methyltransferase CheR